MRELFGFHQFGECSSQFFLSLVTQGGPKPRTKHKPGKGDPFHTAWVHLGAPRTSPAPGEPYHLCPSWLTILPFLPNYLADIVKPCSAVLSQGIAYSSLYPRPTKRLTWLKKCQALLTAPPGLQKWVFATTLPSLSSSTGQSELAPARPCFTESCGEDAPQALGVETRGFAAVRGRRDGTQR